MIYCDNILKQYGEQVVLSGFSQEFADTGIYLLLGESGSGKTTFLNILSGMIALKSEQSKLRSKSYAKPWLLCL